MKARLLADGATVELFKNGYSDRFPLSLLPQRLTFYRSMRDRQPTREMHGRSYPWAAIYGQTVEALERVQKISKAMAPGA